MSNEREFENAIESERYELFEKPTYLFEFDRRGFLKVFGSGIFVVTMLDSVVSAQRPQGGQGESGGRLALRLQFYLQPLRSRTMQLF